MCFELLQVEDESRHYTVNESRLSEPFMPFVLTTATSFGSKKKFYFRLQKQILFSSR